MDSIRTLVAKAQSGDHEAQQAFFDEYRPVIAAQLRRVNGMLARGTDPEDVEQSVKSEVLARLPRYKVSTSIDDQAVRAKLGLWVKRITIGIINTHYRKAFQPKGNKVNPASPTSPSDSIAKGAPVRREVTPPDKFAWGQGSKPGVGTALGQKEEQENMDSRFDELLKMLPPDRSNIIQLRREGLGWPEICVRIGATSTDAVRMEAYRATEAMNSAAKRRGWSQEIPE